MRFISPSYGECENTESVVNQIVNRIKEKPYSEWIIAIGSDSQNRESVTKICNAILLLEKGHGGTYFYSVHSVPRLQGLQHRMFREAEMSIQLGHEIIELFEDKYLEGELGNLDYNIKFEIHCDLGLNGKSKDSIKAAIGWITAEFGDKVTTKIKPHSIAASCVADKYTK